MSDDDIIDLNRWEAQALRMQRMRWPGGNLLKIGGAALVAIVLF